ncbi:DUF2254 family protein [Nonomuraea sp. NPDC059194]|uniref:DUF2254 family protein n=1 Tax=Nonomuraea sp. NPDC059194 TaxID=3346764 RepID=UPI003673DB5F
MTGAERTFDQDVRFGFRLLTDITLRALSQAVNDPATAVQSLEQIDDLLRRLAGKALDIGYAADAHDRVRLVIPSRAGTTTCASPSTRSSSPPLTPPWSWYGCAICCEGCTTKRLGPARARSRTACDSSRSV